jgi:hypothetical protein
VIPVRAQHVGRRGILSRARLAAVARRHRGDGTVRDRATPEEDGGVLVFELAARLDLDAALACDFRGGDVW